MRDKEKKEEEEEEPSTLDKVNIPRRASTKVQLGKTKSKKPTGSVFPF